MHLKPPTDMQVVKWQEKEERLTAFIAADIRERISSSANAEYTYTLIARSLESPVVRALVALSGELSRSNISVRLVMSSIDLMPHDEVVQIDEMQAHTTTTRLASDSRLFDAHEQLVLSNNRVWIGDVLRREPAKRDAYENYSTSCEDTVRFAQLAFERIWSASKPVAPIQVDNLALSMDDGHNVPLALGDDGRKGDAGPSAGTRH